MDILMDVVHALENVNIKLLIAIAAIIVFIVLVIVKGTILQNALRLITKQKTKFYYMIIPTSLALILNILLLFAYYMILTKNNIDVIEIIFAFLFKSITDYRQIIYLLLALLGTEVLFIIIQAFVLKLIPFDLGKLIKKLLCKIFKKEYVEKVPEDESEIPTRPSYVNGLLAGLLCFAVIFFLGVLFVFLGEFIGSKYIV